MEDLDTKQLKNTLLEYEGHLRDMRRVTRKNVETLAEGASVAPFGARYFDGAGREIPRAELLAGIDHDGDSSYGGSLAEPWMVYVLEGLIALVGLVFIRYFLTL